MRLLSLVVWLGLIALLAQCGADRSTVVNVPDGQRLSVQHCGGCHAYPEPGLLDQATWQNYVLPRMGHRLGIYRNNSERATLIEAGAGGQFVEQANVYPAQAQLTEAEWTVLQTYYLDHAPQRLDSVPAPPLIVGLPTFRTHVPDFRLSPPSTTLVSIKPGGFFIGDANSRRLYQFDAQQKLLNAANVREGAVSLTELPDALNVTVMGSFSPTDAPTGFVLSLPTQAGEPPRVLLDSLQRPVHTAYADLNADGRPDIITGEFGKWTGGLAWWENLGGNHYEKRWLRPRPGATRVYVRDLNGDQQPDLLALFGQGDEGVFGYYNQGNGAFREEALVRFPPSYGSSSLMLYDTDGDGYEDLVHTAGDNADYPPVTKPYHGIRIFRNDGTYHFREDWFYPLPGAYGAFPADFDQDGDLDIAAISFFPDYAHSAQRGFVYLENQGNFQFKEYTFPEVTDGRWLAMDAGDVDQDGDVDIILGSLSFEVVPPSGLLEQWVERGVPFVLLENTLR